MIKQRKKAKPLRKRHEIKRKQIKRRALIRKIKYITVLIVLLIIIIFAIILHSYYKELERNGGNGNQNNINGNNIGIEVGQIAPDFELTDTDGNSFTLMDYRGSIIILDFMADRCSPCHEEMDHLKEVHSNYSSKAVRIISIGVDNSESAEQLNNNVKDAHGCDWLFAAGGGMVGNKYGIEYIPTIYIIDEQGIITYKNVGLTDYSILQSEIEKLL